MSYSQGSEERSILDYFGGRVGRFLDVGANPLFSNTLRLAELGWQGLAVEADPHAFCKLLDAYAEHRVKSVASLHALVGTEPGIIKFYGSGGDGISTTSEPHREKWSGQTSYREFFMPTITVRDMLDRFGPKFEMVSLDTEATSVDILKRMPLTEMGTELIVVEHDGRIDEVKEYCASHGLGNELLRNAENLIIGRWIND